MPLIMVRLRGTVLAQLYDKLGDAGAKLLPMVYKNLKHLNDPLLQSIKSYYRYVWAKNHYFYEQLKKSQLYCPRAQRHWLF